MGVGNGGMKYFVAASSFTCFGAAPCLLAVYAGVITLDKRTISYAGICSQMRDSLPIQTMVEGEVEWSIELRV